MSTPDFFLSFLKRKLGNLPFQVWRYRFYQNKETLIYHGGGKERISPVFSDSPKKGTTHTIDNKKDSICLSFFYPEGDQVQIYIFHEKHVLSDEDVVYLYHFIYLSLIKETIQSKDTELTNLIESFHSITTSLNLDDVLEKIVRNALKVIPASDAGYLLLYDPSVDRLIPKAPVGFNQNIYNFRVKIGESVTGKVFEDGIGRIFNSKKELFDAMFQNKISDENYHSIISSANTPQAALCVPVSIKEKRIGVMIIHQWYKKKVLVQHDLTLLQGFAIQAAIAIQNAQFYSEANQRLAEVTQLSKQLKERNIQLQKRDEVHETLTNISLQNKGVETIIYEFNRMLDSSVSFLSVLENKFYSSNASQSVFTIFDIKTIFMKKRIPVHINISDPSTHSYYLFPIYNGIAFLGCLIINVKENISESDKMTLEHGSSILTLELVKKQTITEIFYKKTHEQFEGLLNLYDKAELDKQAKELGLTPSAYWFITIFEIPYYADFQVLETEIHKLVLMIKNELPKSEKLVYGFHNKVILLISVLDPLHTHQVFRTFQTIKKDWDNSHNPVFRGGISALYKGLENIKKCYEEANMTLSYLTNRNKTEIISYEDIGLNRLFINQPSQEIERFINEVFSPLWTEDNKYHELEKTLLTFIEYNRSATKTAKKLHIHINTLYQRIKKIEELLQLDFNRNEDYLKLQLASHLRANRDGPSTSTS